MLSSSASLLSSAVSSYHYLDAVFTRKWLRKDILLISGLFLINKLGVPGNALCVLYLCLMASRNTSGAIKALTIMGLVIVGSRFYVSLGWPISMGKFVLLGIAAMTVYRDTGGRTFGQGHVIGLFAFAATCALLAWANGYYTMVSILKITSFTLGAFVFLSAAYIRRDISNQMMQWGFALSVVIIGLSVLAYLAGVGFGAQESVWGRRFSGFRGVFTHPQIAGTVLSLIAIYLTYLLLVVRSNMRRLQVGLVVVSLGLTYLSEARTGLYAYVIVTLIAIGYLGLTRMSAERKRWFRKNRQKFVSLVVAAVVAATVAEFATGRISATTAEFVAKGQETEEFSVDFVFSSREAQIRRAWANFQDHFYTGIGFGTDLSEGWQRKATFLSASTEKGFLPAAILEEVGVIGGSLFVVFLLSVFLQLMRGRQIIGFVLFLGILIINLGEMMFFSFGGMAMIAWAYFGLATFLRDQVKRPGPVSAGKGNLTVSR